MAQGQNKQAAIAVAVEALPGMMQAAEDYFGAGAGADKQAAVIHGASIIVGEGAAVAGANNPKYEALAPLAAPLASFFASIIAGIVTRRKLQGNPIVATPFVPAPSAPATPAP